MNWKEKKISEIMQDSMGIAEPFTLEKIPGGLSGSEIFKVDVTGKSLIFRFWNMQWADYYPQDHDCQLIASSAGYGPKTHYSDRSQGITVMDYHPRETISDIKMRLQALVDLVKKIHSGPEVPKGLDRLVYLDLLFDELKETPYCDLKYLQKIKNDIFAATRPTASCVPCHRDLHHGNLLCFQGIFYAIDYTWGAMDDPFTDLANIAVFNCQNSIEENILLELYLRRTPMQSESARFSLMKVPIQLFYGLEFLGAATANKNYLSATQQFSKRYMEFGLKGNTHTQEELLHFGLSLLNEAKEYSQSEQYLNNITILNTRN
jgi:thiamine kinase-like enzyme